MFDWLVTLFLTFTVNAWILYGAGIAVGILLGIQMHMTWCKLRDRRQDEREWQDELERRIADVRQTDHDAVAWKLLEECDFL